MITFYYLLILNVKKIEYFMEKNIVFIVFDSSRFDRRLEIDRKFVIEQLVFIWSKNFNFNVANIVMLASVRHSWLKSIMIYAK